MLYPAGALLPRQVANWTEPILKGDIPRPRKGAAAAATGNVIYMFGGQVVDEEGQAVAIDELVVFQCSVRAACATWGSEGGRGGRCAVACMHVCM